MGKIKYTGSTTAYLTTNGEYPIVAVSSATAGGVGSLVSVVSDTGALYTIDTTSPNVQVIELYAAVRVI